jgi:opacity protein-like surface antigen
MNPTSNFSFALHFWGLRSLGLVCVAWLFMIAGCGGGGSSQPTAAPPTVGTPTVSRITHSTLQGEMMRDVALEGAVTGDVESLNGRQLYVSVQDPAALFASTAILQVFKETSGWRYRLDLRGTPLQQPGNYTGNLVVRACLDTACSQPIAGTPMTLPFDVLVQAPIGLSTTQVDVSVPFGTVPAPQPVVVTLSSFSSGWNASNDHYSGTYPAQTVGFVGGTVANSRSYLSSSAGLGLQLQLRPAPVGQYQETVRIGTEVVMPNGSRPYREASVVVRYAVTPNAAIDHYFWPARLDLTIARNEPLIQYASYEALAGPGVSLVMQRTEFTQSAGSSGPSNRWWGGGSYHACIYTGNVADCLAPGVYVAQDVYLLTDALGRQREVRFPVQLTVR